MYVSSQRADAPSLPRASVKSDDTHSASHLKREDKQRLSDSPSWQRFIDARRHSDIKLLVSFIHSTEKARERHPQASEWVSPVTIGGHAVSALAEICKRNPQQVAEALKNDLHNIVEYLNSKNLELRDPSLVLLYFLAPNLNSSMKDRVVNVSGYEGLLKIMMTETRLKRQMAAETARSLYEGDDDRKRKFIKLDGLQALLHVMNMDSDDEESMHNSLSRLHEFLLVRDN